MGFGPAQGEGGTPQSLATTDSPTFAGLTLTGPVLIPYGSISAPGIAFADDPDTGISYNSGSSQGLLVFGGVVRAIWESIGLTSNAFNVAIGDYRNRLNLGGLHLGPNALLAWTATNFGADELSLYRDAANTLAQRNGTSAQAFRLYNTFTDASNYERLAVEWSSDAAYLRAQAAGTGTLRDLHVYAAEFRQQGANGQYAVIKHLTESHTLSAAATSDTAIQIPAGAMVLGVDIRVTTEITGCTTLDVGVAGATQRYGTGIALTAGTTNATCATVAAPTIYQAVAAIRFTAVGGGASFTAGAVRVTVHYLAISAATS